MSADFNTRIEAINEARFEALRVLAAEAMDAVVKPFCREHNLTFWQCNRAWSFDFIADEQLPRHKRRSVGGYIIHYDDFDEAGIDYEEVVEVLKLGTDHMCELFEFMDSYDPRKD